MKLITPLLALTLAVSAGAQTATPAAKPATKPATPAAKSSTAATTTHTATAAKSATAVHSTLNGPSNIPVVHGIKKSLYSLSYIDLVVGTGPLAETSVLGKTREDSHVLLYTVKYTGWLAKDGTKFDSSDDHPNKEPITFPEGVHQVIPGWDDGFIGMHIGGKRRIFVPYQLAYGTQGRPPVIPGKSDLIFDVELVGVKPYAPPPPPPAAPASTKPDAGTPPGDSKNEAKPATPAPDAKPAAPAAAPATPAPAPAPTKPETK